MCGCAGWGALCFERLGVPGEAPQSPFLWQVQGSALLSALPLQVLGSLLAPTGACTEAWVSAPHLRHVVLRRDTLLLPRPASAAPALSPARAKDSQASDERCCGPGVSVGWCVELVSQLAEGVLCANSVPGSGNLGRGVRWVEGTHEP